MNKREYLYNLLNPNFFEQEIKNATTPDEIYHISKMKKQAEKMKLMIDCSKTTIQYLHYEDDIPDAIDYGIPITAELTPPEHQKIIDDYIEKNQDQYFYKNTLIVWQ